jgi:hypothetical protein
MREGTNEISFNTQVSPGTTGGGRSATIIETRPAR